MSNRYLKIKEKIDRKELIILDGGVGTELQKRGIEMDGSWCGSASLNTEILKQIHLDYIEAGAEIITANTYASSRLMLEYLRTDAPALRPRGAQHKKQQSW